MQEEHICAIMLTSNVHALLVAWCTSASCGTVHAVCGRTSNLAITTKITTSELLDDAT
jgi:hypothetical protein